MTWDDSVQIAAASPRDGEWVGLWENESYRVSMSINDHAPLRRARRALRAAADGEKFGGGHFGFGTLVTH